MEAVNKINITANKTSNNGKQLNHIAYVKPIFIALMVSIVLTSTLAALISFNSGLVKEAAVAFFIVLIVTCFRLMDDIRLAERKINQ